MRKQILDASLIITIYEMLSTGPNTVVKRQLFSTSTFDNVGQLDLLNDIISYSCNVNLQGDILIVCHVKNALRDEKIFRFSFHTGFIPNENVLRLKKSDIDEACHNKTPYIPDKFMIDLMFDDIAKSDAETRFEENVSFNHLYAKTDPNTRNHILLEFCEDSVQEVVKKKLSAPRPLPTANVRSVSAPPMRIKNVPVDVLESNESIIKSSKPDILVQMLTNDSKKKPILVKFRVKKQK